MPTLTLTPRTIGSLSTLLANGIFNVATYGARGVGSSFDDTSAIQAAITAAIAVGGTVYFPPPSVYYNVSSSLSIVPAGGGSECYVDLLGAGSQSLPIVWTGANSGKVFVTSGWRVSRADNIHVYIPSGKTGVTAWSMDNTGAAISSTNVLFNNCSVYFTTGTSNGYGWRLGATGALTDISNYTWNTCQVYGGAASSNGHVGYSIEQANAIGFSWFGGQGLYMYRMIKVVFGSGFNVSGLHGSHNGQDFRLEAPAALSVRGGYFELGQRLLACEHNTNQTHPIVFTGVKCYNYTGESADGMVFHVLGCPAVTLDGCEIVNRSGSDFTNALVSMYCDGAGVGSLNVRGGVFQAADPFYRTIGGSTATFTTYLSGAVKANNVGVSTALFTVRP